MPRGSSRQRDCGRDRELRDVLAIHSDVARAVAREIEITLTLLEDSRLARAQPVDPEAYEAYLKRRYHLNRFRELERLVPIN